MYLSVLALHNKVYSGIFERLYDFTPYAYRIVRFCSIYLSIICLMINTMGLGLCSVGIICF